MKNLNHGKDDQQVKTTITYTVNYTNYFKTSLTGKF